MTAAPTATTRYGRLQGTVEKGVPVFRGVPYAAPPVGPRRFRPAVPPEPWTGVRDATVHGPIAPQNRSRLAIPMGDFDRPQGEDCLTLTIWTPAADDKRRPVLIFFHGGAFVSGAGSLDWYSGASLAAHGDIVVVGVNYRLGVLGFMHRPGVSETNLGLHDQARALDWVVDEITGFGGDPGAITIAGQSAGGLSVIAMLANPATRAKVRRGIIQSSPFGRTINSRESAAEVAAVVERHLGITDPEQWWQVTPAAILAAQLETMKHYARFADASSPFFPVGDRDTWGLDMGPAGLAGAAERDVMIGYTRDESAAFFAKDPRVLAAAPEEVEGRFRDFFGAAAREAMAEYEKRARDAGPVAMLSEMVGDSSLAARSLGACEHLAAIGKPAYVYRFDWAAPDNPFRACHCIELPFMFDSLEHWRAPMLEGGDPVEMAGLAAAMRDAWIGFVRFGDPNHAGLPRWPKYDLSTRFTMLFDAPQSRVAADPAGRKRWRYWP